MYPFVGFGHSQLTIPLVDRPPPLGDAPTRQLVCVTVGMYHESALLVGYVVQIAGAAGHD